MCSYETVCLSVCLSVCVKREADRKKERKKERENEKCDCRQTVRGMKVSREGAQRVKRKERKKENGVRACVYCLYVVSPPCPFFESEGVSCIFSLLVLS